MNVLQSFKWWNRMSEGPQSRRRTPGGSFTPRSIRPQIDVLEDRTVPATLNVNVAGTGGAFTSIQAAIDASTDGDTIQVAPGAYHENVIVNKSVALLGAEAGILSFNQSGGQSLVDGGYAGSGFQVVVSGVIIDGFTVANSGSATGGAGISIDSSVSNISILDNILTGNEVGLFLNGTDVLVQGNTIVNNNLPGPSGGSGIYSDGGSANVTITDNRFLNNANGAITFGLLPLAIRSNPADPLRNVNLLVEHNSFYDINLGTFTDITNGAISENFVQATDQFSSIGITGGVIGLTITGNDLSGGTRGVRIVGPAGMFDPVPNQNIVISVANQFLNHSVAAIEVEAGSTLGTVNATRNWWSASTGPTIASNPSGAGEALIAPDANVDFGAWSVTPHSITPKLGAFVGLSADQVFVQHLYLDALGRQGSVAELNGWVQTLQSSSQAAVALAIETSFEARDKLVKSWYVNYLGREAGNGEELSWVNLLQTTLIKPEERTLSLFLSSDEFYARAQTLVTTGTPDENYVQALYMVVLGRSGSAPEISSWVGNLSSLGRAGVAFSIIDSVEARTKTFENYYNVLLERAADTAGLNDWVSSGLGDLAVRVSIEGSAEFFGLD